MFQSLRSRLGMGVAFLVALLVTLLVGVAPARADAWASHTTNFSVACADGHQLLGRVQYSVSGGSRSVDRFYFDEWRNADGRAVQMGGGAVFVYDASGTEYRQWYHENTGHFASMVGWWPGQSYHSKPQKFHPAVYIPDTGNGILIGCGNVWIS